MTRAGIQRFRRPSASSDDVPDVSLEALSRRFAAACNEPPAGPRIELGLEHEFIVRASGGTVDFRTVIHTLGLPWPSLDPADPNAYRLGSGTALTSDGPEAEIALPPQELGPGFAHRLDGGAAWERRRLARRLARRAPPLRLEGCSTHLSISIPPGDMELAVADLFARRFAPGLMLLMDRPQSPGLLVRPRPGRLELGGEFVTGRSLQAALAYAAGATLAAIHAARGLPPELPPEVVLRLEPAILRFGWYVDRRAFGPDLYAEARSSELQTTTMGHTMSAQEHLDLAWAIARGRLARITTAADLAPADAIVARSEPLPIEDPWYGTAHPPPAARSHRPRSPFGSIVATRHRPGFDLAPVLLTWDAAVFVIASADRGHRMFAGVPRAVLGGFLGALERGDLDPAIVAYLQTRPAGRTLTHRAQLERPALFDELGRRADLLPPERDQGGRLPADPGFALAEGSVGPRSEPPRRARWPWTAWRSYTAGAAAAASVREHPT